MRLLLSAWPLLSVQLLLLTELRATPLLAASTTRRRRLFHLDGAVRFFLARSVALAPADPAARARHGGMRVVRGIGVSGSFWWYCAHVVTPQLG